MVKRAECSEGFLRTSFSFSQDELRQIIIVEEGPMTEAEFIVFEAEGGRIPDVKVVCLENFTAIALSPYLREVLKLPVTQGDKCERCIFRDIS